MKKTLKKAIALLTAGVLLSASAAVYAAQVPAISLSANTPAMASSQIKLGLTFEIVNYTLTESKFDVMFNMVPAGNYQFRWADTKITVEAQTADGGWEQVYFGGSSNGGDPHSIHVETQVDLKEGQKVRVYLEGKGEAFGSSYLGSAYGSGEFEFTL